MEGACPKAVWSFDDALPALRAALATGRLVPFAGAGVSRPHCRGWPDFIEALYSAFGAKPIASLKDGSPELLYRAADKVAGWLHQLPPAERRERLRFALHDPYQSGLPPQALALASFPWPLIITTNYDDVMPRALKKKQAEVLGYRDDSHAWRVREPRILGRSQSDCAQVVRSLDGFDDPMVWYVQGNIGPTPVSADSSGIAYGSLLDEVVVGHQQYQHAINASQPFRRAFSEVFRRRSLLFVGSGLAESYLINLIGETLFSLGPSSQPHFALFSESDLCPKTGIDPEFLSVRLGITPVCYGPDHGALARRLEQLSAGDGSSLTGRQSGLSQSVFCLDHGASALELRLRHRELGRPSDGECVIASVGRDPWKGKLEVGLGAQASGALAAYCPAKPLSECEFDDVPTLRQGRMFRLREQTGRSPLFFLAARGFDRTDDRAARSLDAISEATEEALGVVAADYAEATMGVMAAGPERTDDPYFCLVAQLLGIRAFVSKPPPLGAQLRRINIDIHDTWLWLKLASGRVPVLELLTSDMARILLRVAGAGGAVEEFAVSVPRQATIKQVLDAYRIATNGVDVSARPLPRKQVGEVLGVQVFPGMTIDVLPPSPDGVRSAAAR